MLYVEFEFDVEFQSALDISPSAVRLPLATLISSPHKANSQSRLSL